MLKSEQESELSVDVECIDPDDWHDADEDSVLDEVGAQSACGKAIASRGQSYR